MPKKYIKLNAGDPDVEAPKDAIKEALIGIIEGGVNTHYPHYSGYPDKFKEAVVNYYRKFTGTKYEPKNIVTAAGSSAALYIALASVLERGDEVMLFNPYYMGHTRIFNGMGVKVKFIPLNVDTNYHPEINDIVSGVTPKTKAILVCNPANPTGTVFTEEECRAIGDTAVDNDLAIFADEIYLHFVYDDNKFVSIASLEEEYKKRTLNIMSFSKTFSMTGWRLGYNIVPEKYLEKANQMRSLTAPRPATFVYRMGIACLNSDFKYVEDRRIEYEKRRNYFCKAINGLGWPCHVFEGAFYAWFDARSTGLSSSLFVEKLQKSQNISLSPGQRFGSEGFIRVPLVQPINVLEDVIKRLMEFKSSL
jgi:aspartate/methionine/tyrosine aminotransferase